DPVNIAARLEQIALPGQILVGERTVAAVRSAFEFADPRTVQAKGKPGGIVCRELVRMVSPSRPRGIPLETAFVGREQELGPLEGDTPETVREKLAGRDILGLTLGLDVGADLDPRGAAELLRAEWVDLVTGLARTQPVVLVVEDLHWASEPLSDLLERLLA